MSSKREEINKQADPKRSFFEYITSKSVPGTLNYDEAELAREARAWAEPLEAIVCKCISHLEEYFSRHDSIDRYIKDYEKAKKYVEYLKNRRSIDDLSYIQGLNYIFKTNFDFRKKLSEIRSLLDKETLNDADYLLCEDNDDYFKQLFRVFLNMSIQEKIQELDSSQRKKLLQDFNQNTGHLSDRQKIIDTAFFIQNRESIISVFDRMGFTKEMVPKKADINPNNLNIVVPLGAYGMNNVRRGNLAFNIFEHIFEENAMYVAVSSRNENSVGKEELEKNNFPTDNIKYEADIFRQLIENKYCQFMTKCSFDLCKNIDTDIRMYSAENEKIKLIEMSKSANTEKQLQVIGTYAKYLEPKKDITIYLVSNSIYRYYTMLPIVRKGTIDMNVVYCGVGYNTKCSTDSASKLMQEIKVAISEISDFLC